MGTRRPKRYRSYTEAFRKAAVERMKDCPDVGALADELGVHRRLLYNWRDQALADPDPGSGETSSERALRSQNAQLKRLLAEKTLEADFFRGALQTVAARRRRGSAPGETASTTESGS